MNNPADDDLDSLLLEAHSSGRDFAVDYEDAVSRYEQERELWRERLDRSETETEGGN